MDPSSHQESHRLQRLLGLVAVLALAEWVFIEEPGAASAQAAADATAVAPAAAPAASAPLQVVTLR